MPRKWSGLFMLATIAAGALSGCKRSQERNDFAIPSVRVLKASASAEDEGLKYSVSLLPNRQTDLAFKSAGIIESIRTVKGGDGQPRAITMGDPVLAGVPLAHVRTRDYQQKLDQAQAQLKDATAQHADAEAALKLAETSFKRASNLYGEQSLTKQDYDRALQQRDAALAGVQRGEAGIANANALVEQARLALGDTSLTAPYSGVVVARYVELGNLVGNSTPAFTIAAVSVLKANFTIPESALPLVKLGRKLQIRLADGSREIDARITAISPAADPQSRVFAVQLTVANPRGEFKPGMIGVLELRPESGAKPHILVPVAALVHANDGQGFAVWVIDGTEPTPRVRKRAVSVGSAVGSKVQILSGLAAGDRYVSNGAQLLQGDQTVRVVE
jgi:RND family efflux transporter MFP subunit